MLIVPKNWTIPDYTISNGNEARAIHPMWIDQAHNYVISGHDWACPASLVDGASPIPVLLRPWCEFVAVAVRAVVTDSSTGLVSITMYDEADAVKVSAMDIELDANDLDPWNPAPASISEWNQIAWCGAGAIGYASPPSAGKGSIQLTPSNSWRRCWLHIDLTDAEIYALRLRCYASPNPLP
jgi:hypothetical protein